MPDVLPGNYNVEPSAAVREGAHSVRELFVALMMEGFTEKQALIILGQMLSASLGKSAEE